MAWINGTVNNKCQLPYVLQICNHMCYRFCNQNKTLFVKAQHFILSITIVESGSWSGQPRFESCLGEMANKIYTILLVYICDKRSLYKLPHHGTLTMVINSGSSHISEPAQELHSLAAPSVRGNINAQVQLQGEIRDEGRRKKTIVDVDDVIQK